MFVRKKRNASGSVSIQIIDKTDGYKVVQTVGSAEHPDEIARLWQRGRQIVHGAKPGQSQLFPVKSEADLAVENAMRQLANACIRTGGPELIFGTLFERLGFSVIPLALFRHIVISRLAFPVSKLKTVDYLYRYQGVAVSVDAIYRFLDTLQEKYITHAKEIVFAHTKRILETVSVVFYDMTTLYFEAEDEDDLRKIGFSKDGKFQCPQIMIGLLVGEGGFPIGYDIFEGNAFEGHTLIKTLNTIATKYTLGKPVVVADAAMLSKQNVEALKENGYTFIVGGRIKNETDKVKNEILKLSCDKKDGMSFEVTRDDGTRLIVTYSDKRARKDKHNRAKGVEKLKKKVASGKLTKTHIPNRGYN